MADRILTPQQELFLQKYTDPKSPTFGNAKQSALAAEYALTYAENITDAMPDWLLENMGDMKRLRKAEKNLDEVQNLPIYNEEGKPDAQLIDKRTKVDMFLAERLNKSKYSTKTETVVSGSVETTIPNTDLDALAEAMATKLKDAKLSS